MAGEETAALEALRKANQENFRKLKAGEDELAQKQRATEQAEKSSLKNEVKKIQEHLPSRSAVLKALIFALLIGDALGLILDSTKPIIGQVFDFVMIMILAIILKQNPLGLRSLFVLVLESIPGVDYAPWYTLGVLVFWFSHRSEYGTLGELLSSIKELGKTSNEGIFSGATFNLSGAGVFGIILIILIPGCMVLDLSTTDYQSYNLVGNTAQNIPLYKALKDGGRIERFVDSTTVDAFNWQVNADPLGWLEGYLNKSTALAGNNYYEGEIEDTQYLDLGLQVSDIETPIYSYVGDPVQLTYGITGGTFTDGEDEAEPFCYIQKNPLTEEHYGVPYPASFEMIKDLPVTELVFCEMETEGLEPGFYQVYAGVKYDFEVWSRIEYTFVEQSIFQAYGTEINERLNIDPETKSLDTKGPVALTISELASNIRQPYVIREDRDTNFLVSFKLQNNELGGLTNLNYVILQVPKELKVMRCTRPEGKWSVNDNYAIDIVTKQLPNADTSFIKDKNIVMLTGFTKEEWERPLIEFSCSLLLDKDTEFTIGGNQAQGQKITETIVATAKYEYSVKKNSKIELVEVIA